STRRHTSWNRDWSSDVCSSDLGQRPPASAGDGHDLPVPAEAVEFELDDIAVAQVRVFPGHRDPLRSAGEDDITGFEGHHLAEPVDDLGDGEDEIARRRILPYFAVDPAPQAQVAGVHLGGGSDPRP